MARTYRYDTTWEQTDHLDNVIGSAELRVYYTYSPGCGDYWARNPGCWLPGDPPELEIVKIEEEAFEGGKAVWREITGKFPHGEDRFEYFREWVEDRHLDDMVEEAVATDADDRDRAAEYRAER